MPMFHGRPIPWEDGVICRDMAGRGFPMSSGGGCPTIMADGIMRPSDGVGFRDHPIHSISGRQDLWRSIQGPAGFPGVHWDQATITTSIPTISTGEYIATILSIFAD